MKIVSESCCHIICHRLLYGNNHIFGNNNTDKIYMVYCSLQSFSPINSFNPDGNPDR